MNRSDILLVSSRLPYPVIGGDRLRVYNMAKVLAKDFNVHLVCLCESRSELERELPCDGVFSSVERVLLPKWKSWVNCLFGLFSGLPLQVVYYKSKFFSDVVLKKSTSSRIVISHLVRTAEAVRNVKQAKILEMTDAISLGYERALKHGAGLKSPLFWMERRRLRKYEQACVASFDVSVLVSDVDKEYLCSQANASGEKVLVCSNGVDLDSFPSNYTPDGKTILFIGSMDYHPNIDAVLYFIRNIFPLVRNRIPDVTLRVVGRIHRKEISRFSCYKGVEVTGTVPSIADAARGASIGVCPMRIGAGVQNKVLEYMALGIPAITSAVGLEGLQARAGEDLLVEDDPKAMADKIVEVINNKELARRLSLAGRRYVEENHAWDSRFRPLLDYISSSLS